MLRMIPLVIVLAASVCAQVPTLSLLNEGSGGFTVDLSGLPAGTTEGWTFASFDTSAALGTGPIGGLAFDPFALSWVLNSFPAPAPGSLFHWSLPSGGQFPDVPVNFGAGAMPIGLSLDAVAVTIGSQGVVLSNAARLNVTQVPVPALGSISPQIGNAGDNINVVIGGLSALPPVAGADFCGMIVDGNGQPLGFVRGDALNGSVLSGTLRNNVPGSTGGTGTLMLMSGVGNLATTLAPPAGMSFQAPPWSWRSDPVSVAIASTQAFTLTGTPTTGACSGGPGCTQYDFLPTSGGAGVGFSADMGTAPCPPNATVCFDFHFHGTTGNCDIDGDLVVPLQNGPVALSAYDCSLRLSQIINILSALYIPNPLERPTALPYAPNSPTAGIFIAPPLSCTWESGVGTIIVCP